MNRKRKSRGEGEFVIGGGTALAALAAVAVVAGAVIVLLRGPGLDGGDESPRVESPMASEPAYEAGTGVTDDGHPVIGAASAPVTIVEYSDFQCPNCRQFAVEVLPWLKETWLGRGFVRVIYRDFAIRGDASFAAAEAAHCAGEQGRFWSYHDRLFKDQGKEGAFSRTGFLAAAADFSLDTTAFAACIDSGRHRPKIQASSDEALGSGFDGTPTFLVNGRMTAGAIPVERWNELFRAFETDLTGG